ncbi:UNVERIFIED_CONTAM: hypothetical protein K2H54_043467 [Gekko kuhli]
MRTLRTPASPQLLWGFGEPGPSPDACLNGAGILISLIGCSREGIHSISCLELCCTVSASGSRQKNTLHGQDVSPDLAAVPKVKQLKAEPPPVTGAVTWPCGHAACLAPSCFRPGVVVAVFISFCLVY